MHGSVAVGADCGSVRDGVGAFLREPPIMMNLQERKVIRVVKRCRLIASLARPLAFSSTHAFTPESRWNCVGGRAYPLWESVSSCVKRASPVQSTASLVVFERRQERHAAIIVTG